jgi:hypothetical protein
MDDTHNGPPSPPPEGPPPAPPAEPPPAPVDDSPPPAGDRVDVGRYLSEGWQLFTENPALMLGGFAIVFLILLISAITVVGPLVLVGPLMVGYYGIIEKLRNGRDAEFGELFAGFSDFARTCLAGLLVVLVFIIGAAVELVAGLILNHLPCIGQILSIVISLGVSLVTAALTLFVLPTVTLTPKSPMDALTANIEFAQKFMVPALLLAAVHIGLSLLGSALCLIGLLVTVPVASGFVMAAYHDYYAPRVGP